MVAVVGVVAAGAMVAAVPLAVETVSGHGLAVVADVPGPDDGPVCPVDDRYQDEETWGLPEDVLTAWQELRAAAVQDGVTMCVNDGKRSRAQQQREFDEAVEKFGTEELAAHYVLPPGKSNHVLGVAVDVQPWSAARWVEENGQNHGWCRRYDNEYWHFEFSTGYKTGGCPELLPDAIS